MSDAAHQVPGASRIEKGTKPLLVLSERDVSRLLDPRALLEGLAEGFRAMARGEVQSPPRPQIDTVLGFLLSMPAYAPGMLPAVKVVSVFEGNLAVGLPNHLAVVMLFDPDTGVPMCVCDGTYITAVRTAGAAVVGIDVLARADSRTAVIVGAGVQGRQHLRLLPLVRDVDEIVIASRHVEDAEYLAGLDERAVATTDVEAAVRRADIVCLATHSAEPVIESSWVKAGTHVSSVGYAPPRGELPPELARTGTLFVEDLTALQPPPVGCAELQGLHGATTLGDVLVGRAPGRADDDQVTVYKAMGVAMEDLVAANLAYRAALDKGVGQRVEL